MCEISTIADDWIVKGLHLHLKRVEVRLCPDHQGGISVRKVFASTTDSELSAATKAILKYLEDIDNRTRLYRELDRAHEFVGSCTTILRELAIGRAAEFTFLMHALKRLGVNHDAL